MLLMQNNKLTLELQSSLLFIIIKFVTSYLHILISYIYIYLYITSFYLIYIVLYNLLTNK